MSQGLTIRERSRAATVVRSAWLPTTRGPVAVARSVADRYWAEAMDKARAQAAQHGQRVLVLVSSPFVDLYVEAASDDPWTVPAPPGPPTEAPW